jgi:hypothetical protein
MMALGIINSMQTRLIQNKAFEIGVSTAVGASIFLLLLVSFPSSVDAVSFTSDVESGTHKLYQVTTEHFTIEFSNKFKNGVDSDGDGVSDEVEAIAEYAEASWDTEIEDLDYPTPLDDQDTVYLILDDREFYLFSGALGVTSIFPNGDIYIAVDPYLNDDLMQVTVAHEFFHVIQFGYQGNFIGYDQDINFAESTATWVEEEVYDDVDDYVNYLYDFFENPDYSIFTGVIPDGSLFEYALNVWPRFLTEYFSDPELMTTVVNAYFNESTPDLWDSYEAYEEVLADDYDSDLRDVFQVFALWNYIPSYYRDGAIFPIIDVATEDADDYPLENESLSTSEWPTLFGTNYIQFELDDDMEGEDFQLTLTKSSDVDFGVVLLPESDTNYFVDDAIYTMIEAGDEEGTLTMSIEDGYTVMTAIITPLSDDPMSVEDEDEAFEVGYQYFYSVEVGDFLAGGESEVETSEEGEVDIEGGDEKEGSAAEEKEVTEFDTLSVMALEVTASDEDSVSLSWIRPSGSDAEGYYVYYGTESGVYDYYEEVVGAHVTHTTIKDLWWDSAFYFVVTAYDEDFNESITYSPEVEVALEAISYSDVDEDHDNYNAIHFLSYLGILEGYSDGTFGIDLEINRAELTKVLVYGVLGFEPESDYYSDCFSDVGTEWFAPYVCYAQEQEWVQGYSDGSFGPANTVSKVEALKMIMEAYSIEVPSHANVSDLPYSGVYSSAWYAPYLVTAYDLGLLEETSGDFNSNDGRTRSEITEEIFRLLVMEWMGVDAYDDDVLEEFLEAWGDYFL